jgi:membrane protein involved in D-alanine export
MGLWHGIEPHYIVYGLYMATLLSAFHIFSIWKKVHHYWREGPLWNALAVFITFNAVCFGMLIFSGRIGAPLIVQRPPEKASTLESVP